MKLSINSPRMKNQQEHYQSLDAALAAGREDGEIEGIHLESCEAAGRDYMKTGFTGCLLENVKFPQCDFEKSSFVDVIFRKCDFSNSVFKDCYFRRCEFLSCKGVGADLRSAVMKHVRLNDTNFQYANLNGIYLEQVLFEGTDLTEASMSEMKYKNWTASDTKFVGTNFFHTRLKDFDFSQCEIADLIVSEELEELKGIRVNPVQALEIVKLLKITVV